MAIQVEFLDTKFIRALCPKCNNEALVQDEKFLCCGVQYVKEPITAYKREITIKVKRKLPPIEIREKVLLNQNFRCFYCIQAFGEYEQYRRIKILLRVTWDHLIPYSYIQSNPEHNFVACCQICNSLKWSMVFSTLEEAREYVQQKREEKGYKKGVANVNSPLSNLLTGVLSSKIKTETLQFIVQTKELEGPTPTYITKTGKSNCRNCGIVFKIISKERDYCSEKCKLDYELKEKRRRHYKVVESKQTDINYEIDEFSPNSIKVISILHQVNLIIEESNRIIKEIQDLVNDPQ